MASHLILLSTCLLSLSYHFSSYFLKSKDFSNFYSFLLTSVNCLPCNPNLLNFTEFFDYNLFSLSSLRILKTSLSMFPYLPSSPLLQSAQISGLEVFFHTSNCCFLFSVSHFSPTSVLKVSLLKLLPSLLLFTLCFFSSNYSHSFQLFYLLNLYS